MDIVKDQLILITAGSYSDYDIDGLFKALKPFNTNTVDGLLIEAIRKASVEFFGREGFKLAWLVREGYLEEISEDAWTEWNLS